MCTVLRYRTTASLENFPFVLTVLTCYKINQMMMVSCLFDMRGDIYVAYVKDILRENGKNAVQTLP